MSAKIIDGKILAAEVKACAAQAVRFLQERYGITPCLAVLLVGDDPASQVYVRGKANDCEACGIESRVIRLPAGTTQAELLARLGALAADSAVHGILVQLPLPRHIDPAAVIEAIRRKRTSTASRRSTPGGCSTANPASPPAPRRAACA